MLPFQELADTPFAGLRERLPPYMIRRITFSRFVSSLLITGSYFSLLPAAHAGLPLPNKALIWRGFQHDWTYNHRCNRLGDFVQYNGGHPTATHTSATGLGTDSTVFSSYYSFVASPHVSFKEGKESIVIRTDENTPDEHSIFVSFPAPSWLKNKAHYTTFLNGFDLRSEAGANKIQHLKITIENAIYDLASDQIKFKIS